LYLSPANLNPFNSSKESSAKSKANCAFLKSGLPLGRVRPSNLANSSTLATWPLFLIIIFLTSNASSKVEVLTLRLSLSCPLKSGEVLSVLGSLITSLPGAKPIRPPSASGLRSLKSWKICVSLGSLGLLIFDAVVICLRYF